MPSDSRARHLAAAASALVTAVALTACSTVDTDTDTARSEATSELSATAEPGATSPSGANSQSADATVDGVPVDDAARAISNELIGVLAAVPDELGDVEVDLLQLYPDYVSLVYVDPDEPDTRYRVEFRDSAWSPPMSMRRPDVGAPLPLDAIDPETLRVAFEATPGLLEIDDARLSHVSISPDESGQTDILIALATDVSLGRATFGPDGQVREIQAPL
ncbi:hypothetical protein ABIE38_003439 [Dietzia sp. 2505]|uniref:hypothetical protein n=1 Tax=Dietzia sp. 2505 TaxID=3156457 RepID=UPI00339513A5